MLGLGNCKVGRGLIRGILTFPCDDHYRPSNTTWARDLCTVLSLAVWWAKLEKNNKVRHIVTQIASLLAVATVFIDLLTPFYSQGGGLIRETKLPMQELELKMEGGGLMHEGGRNRGILRYMYENLTMSSVAS